MWCCPAQCRAVEVGLAPSDHQEGDHDDHVVKDKDDNDDAILMCAYQ